jgi:signal transduction histidine kinase
MRRSSLRRQLIAWNTLTLCVILGVLGLASHFASYGYALNSVDAELSNRVHPPPNEPPPPGPPQARPPGDRLQGDRLQGGRDGDRPGFGGPPPDGPGVGGPGAGGPENGDPQMGGPELGGPGMGGPGVRRPGMRRPGMGGPGRGPGGPPRDPFGFGPGRPPGPGGDEQRPRVYSLSGVALQRWNTQKPWDMSGLGLAVADRPTFTTVAIDGEPYRVASRLLSDGPADPPEKAVVQAAYPLSDLNRATGALDRGLLALIPLGGLGAWIGATFLTRRVLGRVSKFAHAAERMGEDDLSRRLPIEGNDEFGDLANTFNGLLSRLEEAFLRQASALEQQRRFTADASHELKTPLTVIKGTTSMALAGRGLDERSLAAFQEINHAADGMVKLVHDLLYLARADAGSLATNPQEILAIEVVEGAKAAVGRLHGGQVQFGSVDPEATIWGNEQELVRLFTNLLSNARIYTPETGKVEIAIRACATATQVIVADNGCGIAAEHLGRLGQRFYRADPSRSREDGGTGLGLAIVVEIVRAHRGTIRFESVLGKGTKAIVELPSANPGL